MKLRGEQTFQLLFELDVYTNVLSHENNQANS